MTQVSNSFNIHPSCKDVLSALESGGYAPRKQGSGHIARCPAHDDHDPSLNIAEKKDGSALLHCFSNNCDYESILKAIGLWTNPADIERKDESIVPYHTRKQVKLHSPAHIKGNNLIVPCIDIDGKEKGYIEIFPKKFKHETSGKWTDKLFRGKDTNHWLFLFGVYDNYQLDNCDSLLVATGYSTAASIHDSTGGSVVMATNDNGMFKIIPQLRNKYPDKEIIVCADYDAREKFASLALNNNCRLCYAPMVNGSLKSDFNDLMIDQGKSAVCEVVGEAKFVTADSIKESDSVKPDKQQQTAKEYLLVKTDTKGSMSLISHNEAAALLYREEFNELLHFDPVVNEWYQYQSTGIFKIRPDLSIQQVIYRAIVKHCGEVGFSASYVSSVTKCLMFESVRESTAPKDKVCFINGTLDLQSRKLLEHKPDYFFTSQLPFEWQPYAPDPTVVIDWLREATGGNDDQVQLLRAWFHSVIVGRSDLQRFLEVIGFGGSGKGTLIRLCMAIVGREATHSTMLKQLEENRFETAKIFNKRLVVITDAEKWHGDVSVLKSITGQDPIRFEEKNKQSGDSFTYGGMVLIAANQHTTSTDYSSGIQRRRITVMFDHVVATDKRRDLDSEFEPLLSGVVRWALDMPESEVTDYLLNTSSRVESLKSIHVDSLTATNPIVGWLMDSVEFDKNAETQIGSKDKITKTFGGRDEPKTTRQEYANWQTRLYPNYCAWCDRSGKNPIGLQSFARNVIDASKNMLNKPFVDKRRNAVGATVIKGVYLKLTEG